MSVPQVAATLLDDPPRALRPDEVGARYGITPRLAGEWIRGMVAAGVARKLGRVAMARLSIVDEWVASGGVSMRGRR